MNKLLDVYHLVDPSIGEQYKNWVFKTLRFLSQQTKDSSLECYTEWKFIQKNPDFVGSVLQYYDNLNTTLEDYHSFVDLYRDILKFSSEIDDNNLTRLESQYEKYLDYQKIYVNSEVIYWNPENDFTFLVPTKSNFVPKIGNSSHIENVLAEKFYIYTPQEGWSVCPLHDLLTLNRIQFLYPQYPEDFKILIQIFNSNNLFNF